MTPGPDSAAQAWNVCRPSTKGEIGLLNPRVLYLIDSLAPGGSETSLVEMTPGLLALGIDLHVAVLHDRVGLSPALEGYGVEVTIVGGSTRREWLRHALTLVGQIRPDLVHTTLFESDLIGRLAGYARRIPVVSTLASTPYGDEHLSEPGVRNLRLRGAQLADLMTGKLVTRFHAVSESAAVAAVRRLRINPSKIEVIPRGRDGRRLGERTPSRRTSVRRSLDINDSAPLMLVVARQEPQKGIDILLKALPGILSAEPRAKVVIAGREGRATGSYEAFLRDGVQNAVKFLGQRDDISDLLATADVFVLPSLREGLPGAALEAMAVGTPIVASDLTPIREAVGGPQCAYLVPAGQPDLLGAAVLEALHHPEQATEKAAAAQVRFSERFDIQQVSSRMADFYRRVLDRG